MSVSRRLVIDTNILRSAGGENAIDPTSRHCRELLQAILKICHKAAVSETLRDEWDEHQSRFASRWRLAMQSRKKIVRIEATEKAGLRLKVLAAHQQASTKQDAARKDFHLVEAAIDSDWIVISLDDVVRRIFAESCEAGDNLAKIMWVHPDDETILEWLENGALPADEKRLIVYITD